MKQWPHAPVHILEKKGAYMVTCGTYLKQHRLNSINRLNLVQSLLFEVAEEYRWILQAWAIMSNHYHFVALSPENPKSLSTMLSKLHTKTAIEFNRQDKAPGRKVWHQYYDSQITYTASYLSRLKYVHQNPSHHNVVANAVNYPWCSASWFARLASPSQYKTIYSFKTDRINVVDDFGVMSVPGEEKSGVEPPHSKNSLQTELI